MPNGPAPLPPGTESFDRDANSLEGMFDSCSPSNFRPLIRDPIRGTIANEQDTTGQRNQNQQGIKIKTVAETHANN
jgi:hypothetical protein